LPFTSADAIELRVEGWAAQAISSERIHLLDFLSQWLRMPFSPSLAIPVKPVDNWRAVRQRAA